MSFSEIWKKAYNCYVDHGADSMWLFLYTRISAGDIGWEDACCMAEELRESAEP